MNTTNHHDPVTSALALSGGQSGITGGLFDVPESKTTKPAFVPPVPSDGMTISEGTTPAMVGEGEQPDEKFVRGRCPECGDFLVSNIYSANGSGYLLRWECWQSLQQNPKCEYFHVL
jgi:hypothetical protein